MARSSKLAYVALAGLFGRCLACDSAAEPQLQLLNKIVGAQVLDVANNATVGHLPKTLGDCSKVTDDALKPCQDVAGFPLKGDGFNFDYSINYVTQVDSLRIRNISAHCSSMSSQENATSKDKAWFADFTVGFSKLALGTTVNVHFPQLVVEAPCSPGAPCFVDLDDVALRVAARTRCLKDEALGIQMDPDVGVQFSRPLEFDIYGNKMDFTKILSNVVGAVIEQAQFPCPPDSVGPGLICRALCSLPDDLEDADVSSLDLKQVAAAVPKVVPEVERIETLV